MRVTKAQRHEVLQPSIDAPRCGEMLAFKIPTLAREPAYALTRKQSCGKQLKPYATRGSPSLAFSGVNPNCTTPESEGLADYIAAALPRTLCSKVGGRET